MQKNKKFKPTIFKWQKNSLLRYARAWVGKLKLKKGPANENSLWWLFIYKVDHLIEKSLLDFISGNYRFSPMSTYKFEDPLQNERETIVIWEYIDRLIIKWIYGIIKPLFKHIIPDSCLHLNGPAGVKLAIKKVKQALDLNNFRYFLRIDIKSYYASINHNILVKQIEQLFDDPRLLKYLADIINIPVIKDATIFSPDTGLPTRYA